PNPVIAELTGPKLIEAMYGDLGVRSTLNTETGGPTAAPEWVLGEHGRLAGERAPWVSAVVGLHRGDRRWDWERDWIDKWKAENLPEGPRPSDSALDRLRAYEPELELARENAPSGEYLYLHVVEAASEDAVPLPSSVFDGEHDRRWVFDRQARAH